MLALARKKGETIMIGDDIEIAILNIHGDFVRIGINAPRDIPVHRKEVYEQIQAENKNAAITAEGAIPKLNKLFNEKKI